MSQAASPIVLTARFVVQATGGRLHAGSADVVFASVSIDSRTLKAGALFVALRGDRFDGHAFLAAALDRGATGLLVDTFDGEPRDAAVIVVPDTLLALQSLARAVRRLSGATVIAITGSAGKTTTKEVTADLLARHYPGQVFRNQGNLNNHIGLPLSLLELRSAPAFAVVELGMNHAGEIRTLVGIAEPDVRVWTNVGDAHIGHFGTREGIADAKAEILEQASPATLAVTNADDPLVVSRAARFRGRRVTFGETTGADVCATAVVDRGFDGTSARLDTPAGTIQLEIPLAGRAHLANVLAAAAVAIAFDVPLASIAEAVATLQPLAQRGASHRLVGGARLVDDSYNASPAAVSAALHTLAATRTAGRRVAVLGEMLELGEQSEALHRACGRLAASLGLDVLVTIGGPSARALAFAAREMGMGQERVQHFDDSEAAAPVVARLIGQDDVVLVKGSRGTRTEIVSTFLKAVA